MRPMSVEYVSVVLALISLEFEMVKTEQKVVCHLDGLYVLTLYMVRGMKVVVVITSILSGVTFHLWTIHTIAFYSFSKCNKKSTKF